MCSSFYLRVQSKHIKMHKQEIPSKYMNLSISPFQKFHLKKYSFCHFNFGQCCGLRVSAIMELLSHRRFIMIDFICELFRWQEKHKLTSMVELQKVVQNRKRVKKKFYHVLTDFFGYAKRFCSFLKIINLTKFFISMKKVLK